MHQSSTWLVVLSSVGAVAINIGAGASGDPPEPGDDLDPATAISPPQPDSFGLDFAAAPMLRFGMLQDEDAPEAADAVDLSGEAAAEMAAKLRDPLANIAAIMTDNDILFKTGDNQTSYGFQIQPVKAFDFPEQGFTFITRAVIPILGLAPEGQRPIVGAPLPASSDHTWGIGDIVTQFIFAPKVAGDWKWGAGPQLSWPSHTSNKLKGPGWGGGPVGVLTGSFTDDLSLALIGGHLWSYDGDFSTTLIQPSLFYSFPTLPGSYVGYNAAITYDWNVTSGDAWTLPLGAIVGRTFDVGNGYGLDLSIGAYWNAVKPDGANEWQIKFGVSLLLP